MQIINVKNADGTYKMTYLPTHINSNDIQSITPFFGSKGRIFKNVSTIETYSNKAYNAAENHNSLRERMKPVRVKGFKK